MKKNRIIKIIKRFFIFLVIIGLLCIHFIIPRFITEKRNPVVSFFKDHNVTRYTPEFNESSKFKRKKLAITTFDGLKLSAFLTYSTLANPKGTIILLHGASNDKYHFLDLSEFLSTNGFNSVALDIRGFGESEGQFFTFGVKETKDIQIVIDNLITIEKLSNIGIWGQSIGGAIALQVMGTDKRVKYGIAESTYTDLKSNIKDYFHQHTDLNLRLLTDYLVNRAGSIADFDPNEASPISMCQNITQPVLVVHGGEDISLNIAHGKANFAKIKSRHKKFIKIDSAGHSNIWEVGGEEYFDLVLKFLNNNAIKLN